MSVNYYDEPANYEQKCLCVLVLDTSGSMNENNKIDKLNEGLKTFQEAILSDPVACDRVELSIVTFNSQVQILQQPTLLDAITMPNLIATGQTQLVAALETAQKIVEDRKTFYKSKGVPYYRPWIVVMTDGDPYPLGQDVDGLSAKIQQDALNKKYVVNTIGIGNDVHIDVLEKLTTPPFKAARLSDVKFSEFFQWLSNSITTVVAPQTAQNNIQNPDDSDQPMDRLWQFCVEHGIAVAADNNPTPHEHSTPASNPEHSSSEQQQDEDILPFDYFYEHEECSSEALDECLKVLERHGDNCYIAIDTDDVDSAACFLPGYDDADFVILGIGVENGNLVLTGIVSKEGYRYVPEDFPQGWVNAYDFQDNYQGWESYSEFRENYPCVYWFVARNIAKCTTREAADAIMKHWWSILPYTVDTN